MAGHTEICTGTLIQAAPACLLNKLVPLAACTLCVSLLAKCWRIPPARANSVGRCQSRSNGGKLLPLKKDTLKNRRSEMRNGCEEKWAMTTNCANHSWGLWTQQPEDRAAANKNWIKRHHALGSDLWAGGISSKPLSPADRQRLLWLFILFSPHILSFLYTQPNLLHVLNSYL